MSTPFLEAVGVNSIVTTIRGMVPAAAFESFVEGLPPETIALIRTPPLALTWNPLADCVPLYSDTFERLFGRDPVKMFELGRLQIRADLSTVYRMFIRAASPSFVAERCSKIYETYGRDCGSMRMVLNQPGRIEVLLENRALPSLAYYHYLRGNVFGAIELTGVSGLSVALIDGGGESARSLFRITWS